MKTNFFKKLMMPLAIAVLGVAGAFTTMSMADAEALAGPKGFKFQDALHPCVMVKECALDGQVICKSGTITLWGKVDETQPEPCDVQIYERQ